MQIKNGKLEGVPFAQAQWTGGAITPEIAVVHDTAGRLEAGNSAGYLRHNPSKVSVHFVVERDGAVQQQVLVGHRANHAGRSHYHGRSGCNGFSVGIEIVNPGKMTRAAGGKARAWFGQTFDIAEYGIEAITTPEHGHGLWMAYTKEQIAVVTDLLMILFRDVPTLTDIVPHWYISPGRKVDTNPLFPLEHIKAMVLGREDPAARQAEDQSFGTMGDDYVQVKTHGGTLNMRRWPSFNPNVITAIPDGTRVPVTRRGVFDGRHWLRVIYGGRDGWIVARYTAPATSHQEA